MMPTDPHGMTPDERRHELAQLLAAAIRRLRDRHVLFAIPDDGPHADRPASDFSPDPLEAVPENPLTVHAG